MQIFFVFSFTNSIFCVGADTLRGWLEYDVAGGGSDVRFTNLCDVVLKVDCATHTATHTATLHTHGNAAHTLQHPYWIYERLRYCVEVCIWYCGKSLNMKQLHTYACIYMCNEYMCLYIYGSVWIYIIHSYMYVLQCDVYVYIHTCIYI